ncbi:MAG: endopeptidase La [Candidatus Coatesbacteria bacterium]|nr:endopeptidase La [Candidatus Coatesbacteria bacterium]
MPKEKITTNKEINDLKKIPDTLPLIPLRDLVIFPYIASPVLVGRPDSLNAMLYAVDHEEYVFLTCQKDAEVENPQMADLYRTGTIAKILQYIKLPNNSAKMLIEGLCKAMITESRLTKDFIKVKYRIIEEKFIHNLRSEALFRSVLESFSEYVKLNKRLPDEILLSLRNEDNPIRLSYLLAAHLLVKTSIKQEFLETVNLTERFEKIASILMSEIEILRIEREIEDQVRDQVQKNQREFYLHEQLKAIRKELSTGIGIEETDETEELEQKITEAGMTEEAFNKATKELHRMSQMPSMTPEAAVVRNYLDWLINLPWQKQTEDILDIKLAQRILDEDHYGLEKIKERIVEYLAVRQLNPNLKGPIICFVGPPGVGKTSLGKSIARALNRKFVRVSLGGIRDEAEIRGHRRTYIGSMPGKIIQGIKKAGVKNPVFLLDEIDKLGIDFRGDPSSALLEALDPEQNKAFNDHYIEVDFDLSQVMFITTANVIHTIPPPLLDRMEVLRLPGYIDYEKIEIAKGFLIPKQIKENGLKKKDLSFTVEGLQSLIDEYTKEAGVRNLEREIGSICRKVARRKAENKKSKTIKITRDSIKDLIGIPRFIPSSKPKGGEIGVAVGLAWTSVGGDILKIEALTLPGKGNLVLTGKLGKVMQESAQAAMSFARSRAEILGLESDFYQNLDIHIHLPEGAIPKDGPSAGITMAVALMSALSKKPVIPDIAMTGEITLQGEVIPIGGLNEKLVAAKRAGIKQVLVPYGNKKDLEEINVKITEGMEIKLISDMDEVLKLALDAK